MCTGVLKVLMDIMDTDMVTDMDMVDTILVREKLNHTMDTDTQLSTLITTTFMVSLVTLDTVTDTATATVTTVITDKR